jgi:hypothetical protein
MGWSPIRKVKKAASNVAGAVSDVGAAVDDAILAPVVDPVVKAGEQFEDIVREGVDEIDKAIQNPYVQLAVQVFFPQYAPFLNAYATVDSGEDLSPSQIAAMAAAGYDIQTGEPLPADVKKALDTTVALVEGGDPLEVLISAYSEDIIEASGIKEAGQQALQDAVGSEAFDIVRENMDVARVGYDVLVEGKDPLESITNRYGDEIVGYLGSDDPTINALGYAGLRTAVKLDQGASKSSALIAGAKEYNERGGATPDLGQLASTAGIDLSGIDLGAPEFFNKFATDLGIDTSQFSGIEDYVRQNASYIEDKARLLASKLPEIEGKVNFSALQPYDIDFDYLAKNFKTNIPKVDFSGLRTSDIGDYNLKELGDMGIDVNTLDLNPEFQMIGLAQLLEGDRMQLPTKENEEYVSLQSEFDEELQPEELPFSRQILERPIV